MQKRHSFTGRFIIAIALNLFLIVACVSTPFSVVVVGALREERWIKHLFSETLEVPKGHWNIRVADHLELQALLEASEFQQANASIHNKSWVDPPILFVTNLLADPRIHDVLVAHANTDLRTGLAVVDEANSLADVDCARFRFVIRVGYAHYRREEHLGSPARRLWWQPSNSLLVPLGTPDSFPSSQEVPRSLSDRPVAQRSFTAAYAGRVQNVNRKLALEGLRKLPGLSLVHELTESPPQTPPSQGSNSTMLPRTPSNLRLTSAQYIAWLADSALAPSPPSNHHPECYRTYEALEAGALPVVDSDYYATLWGSGAYFLTVQPSKWDIMSAIHALDPKRKSTMTSGINKGGSSKENTGRPKHSIPAHTESHEQLSPAALEALEQRRIKAVKWWRRLRDEVLPRQVANLVRYTSLERNVSTTAPTTNAFNSVLRAPNEMSGIDMGYLSNVDGNYSIEGTTSNDKSCDSGVVGDATFKALTWSLGLGDVVITGGSLGSTLAVAEPLLRGTGSRSLVHVVGPWQQIPYDQSSDDRDETIDLVRAAATSAAAAWNFEGGDVSGRTFTAAEKQLNRVKPCGGGLPGRVRFKGDAAEPISYTEVAVDPSSAGSQGSSIVVKDRREVFSASTLAAASFVNSTLGVVWLEEECAPGATSETLIDALNAWWPRLKRGGALAGSNFVGTLVSSGRLMEFGSSARVTMGGSAFSVAANANMVVADTIGRWASAVEGARLEVSTSYDATYYFGPSWRIYRPQE